MGYERARTPPQIEVTERTIGEVQSNLKQATWLGDYETALPLAEALLAYRTSIGEQFPGLVSYASTYYSASGNEWKRRGKKRSLPASAYLAAKYLLKAMHALDTRIHGERQALPSGLESIENALHNLTPAELDVVQAVYSRPADIVPKKAQKLVNALIQLCVERTTTGDFFSDADHVALQATKVGLAKYHGARARGESVDQHTEIFLLYSSLKHARRNNQIQLAEEITTRILNAGKIYAWPEVQMDSLDAKHLTLYGQAARVARVLADVAEKSNNTQNPAPYVHLHKSYASLVPDQEIKSH